jgi:23S rRNA (uracil1939-C5)-methyltransferase
MRLLDRSITLDAGLFFQSNAVMLEKLLRDIEEISAEADPGRPAADLYCGVGTFALFLSRRFSHIDLVEENKAALALARENVRGEHIEYFARRDEDWAKLKSGSAAKNPYGFVIADPPRQGLSPGIRRFLAAFGPPLFAYVSCDPASLARDAGELRRGGYELTRLIFYDFYPQTAHIESLALFKRPLPVPGHKGHEER